MVRTGWIYGAGGKNFLSKVIDIARGGGTLKGIRDSYGTPTYVPDLVARLREIAGLDLPGIYHVANAGEGASYEGFARAALEEAGLDASRVEPVAADSLKRPAPRPRNSRMKCLLSDAIGLAPLRDWREACATSQKRDNYKQKFQVARSGSLRARLSPLTLNLQPGLLNLPGFVKRFVPARVSDIITRSEIACFSEGFVSSSPVRF